MSQETGRAPLSDGERLYMMADTLAKQVADTLKAADKLRKLGRTEPPATLNLAAPPIEDPYPEWHKYLADKMWLAMADLNELRRIIGRVEV